MKVPFIAGLLAFIGVTTVVAAPMKLVVVSKHLDGQPASAVRIGLFMPPSLPENHPDIDISQLAPKSRHLPGCKGMMRTKTIQLSNKLRAVLGLPLIESGMRSHHLSTPYVSMTHQGHGRYHHNANDGANVHRHHAPFVVRFTHALNNLGKWEGRAVAFVFGCGLGVLLRIVYVFAVLLVRSCRGKADEDEGEVEYIVFEADNAPPAYLTAEEEKEQLKTAAA